MRGSARAFRGPPRHQPSPRDRPRTHTPHSPLRIHCGSIPVLQVFLPTSFVPGLTMFCELIR